MLFSSAKKISLGYVIAFLLLLFSYALIFYSNSQIRKTERWISHTYIVIAEIEGIKASIAEAESGVRGYALTKEEQFLGLYNNSIKKLPAHAKKIQGLISDNKVQQLRLDTLNHLIQKRLELFDLGIKTFDDSGYVTSNMKARWQESRVLTDSIRFYVNTMKTTEDELLSLRRSRLSGLSGDIRTLVFLSLIAAVLAIGYSIFLYNKERRAKNKYHDELEERIRELKLINEELTRLRSIERFASTGRVASTIAHEVRNPLTNISLASEQLERMTSEESESVVLLEMINRNVIRINDLVSDLLNATKSLQLHMQKVRMSEILDHTLQHAKDRIDLNHIKVEKDYADDKYEVEIDAEKIELAFLNIIINGIEAMEKNKGVLKLSVKSNDQKCIVEITDNGKGMNEEALQRIFEPYYTDKTAGNGLGLTNTQNIILSHKGNINVRSQPGAGTIFTIVIDTGSPI